MSTLLPQPLAVLRLLFLAACLFSATAQAQDQVLNLYSARHYQTDEALYADFTRATGIGINRIDADDAGLLARLKSEGSASPADVILLVDAARLWRAQVDGLFLPIRSKLLETRIPAALRSKQEADGSSWFGFSTRARVIVYDNTRVAPADVDTYEKLAAPINKGRLCTRSGSHPYNLSLFGAMAEHLGPAATQTWLAGLVANMARAPKGGDTDQLQGVASGECAVALVNTYYLARKMRSIKPQDQQDMQRLGVLFPDQRGAGAHVNIAGGAVARYSRQPQQALRFLEYLASDSAQRYFAEGNNEWPAVPALTVNNPALQQLGKFKADNVPVAVIGMNQVKVQQMLDRVGYR